MSERKRADVSPFLVKESEGYQLRAEALREKIGPRTRAIMINSPANPTGIVLSPERTAEIAQMGPMVVSDKIYHFISANAFVQWAGVAALREAAADADRMKRIYAERRLFLSTSGSTPRTPCPSPSTSFARPTSP